MAGYSEKYANLKVEQRQAEGWVEGIYNTHVIYCDRSFAIKFHFHATDRERMRGGGEVEPSAILYNLTKEFTIIDQCNFYKDLLNDILHFELKMAMKIKANFKYNFDVEFVSDSLRKVVNIIHDDIQNIYADLQFEAMSEGRQFYIPLPDNTIQNVTEDRTEIKQRTDIVISDNQPNQIIDLIKKDTSLIIELVKELQSKKERPKYIDPLINEGFIADDGKTALTSLDKIAEYLIKVLELDSVTPQLLKFSFVQADGTEYSLRTAQDAIQRSKTQ
jgi:hypothetical protein